ncbi:MAG TPA: PadR family transcriptional regulator [Gemmatimonadales bacterium]|nr:PadR family transcriptional regulator [Gemmatimonadales bacterium]
MTKPHDGLIPGTLSLLILKSLSHEPMHGYALTKWISQQTGDLLQVAEGVLYPALHVLEREGCLRAQWRRHETGRRAKFYSLTERGRKRLQEEAARWRRSSRAVEMVLSPQRG